MKLVVQASIEKTLEQMKQAQVIPIDLEVSIQLDHPKSADHGDFSTNVAFLLAKPCRRSPREIAAQFLTHFSPHEAIDRIEIAGAGFINFFIKKAAFVGIVSTILSQPEAVGKLTVGRQQKVLVEYISANPTGPLHVGHGRSAAFGASLVNLLKTTGFDVQSEYYVNDAGRQMNILAVSLWLRYLACAGIELVFPTNAYQGEYVTRLAKHLWQSEPHSAYLVDWETFRKDLPADEPDGGDKEHYIDAIIDKAKHFLGQEGFRYFFHVALQDVLDDIREDLAEFGVTYDQWFSEQGLFDEGTIEKSIAVLKQKGYTFEQEGALWFRSTAFGDEKDRVLIRENGQATYFAGDIAYHWNKYERGFERLINIFGADHHGYVSRLQAAVSALGHDQEALQVVLVQFATLFRGKERLQMSTRSGSFVTLRALREEVGNDAARFFYVLRKPEQHMEFDLALATSQSQDNPVYYIQYAYARIQSVFRQLAQRQLLWDEAMGLSALPQLTMPQEESLLQQLNRYHEVLAAAAQHLDPHLVAYYLRDLANSLHTYYNAVVLLCDDEGLRSARLCLLKAVSLVINHGLQLLGVSSPERM